MSVHRFAFQPAYRAAGLPFGVTPRTSYVEVADGRLRVRFGLWRLDTPLTNVKDTQITDGYTFLKTAGPAHLSFTDELGPWRVRLLPRAGQGHRLGRRPQAPRRHHDGRGPGGPAG